MKKIIVLITFAFSVYTYGQGNCLLYPKGSNERKACRLGETTRNYKQGSKESQVLFDSITSLSPNYAWAYKEKSVPYFKRGFILEGLRILNKAVNLEPENHIPYRAYWYFANRNYKKCIEDLETYYALPNAYHNELTPGGDMDMRLLLGMSYAKQGDLKKAISTVEKCIDSYEKEMEFGLLDYYILGMLYVKDTQYNKAIEVLNKQLETNTELAEIYYYLGLAYDGVLKTTKAQNAYKKALEKLKEPYRMRYGYLCFRVYPEEIKERRIENKI